MSYQHKYVDGTNIHFPLGKVVCIGRNYAEHAKELDNPVPTEPLLFIKPGSCVVALEGGFAIPTDRGSVHYEAEIAVLIGKPLSNKPSREEVLLPSWRTSPLMVRRIPISVTSAKVLPTTNGAITAAPSNDLAISQGRPLAFSSACLSRKVKSRAGAKPEIASSTSSRLGLFDRGLPINTAISAS